MYQSTQGLEVEIQKGYVYLPIMEVVDSCGEKCTNLCRVYKLIMISRVPGYGQFEYLEVNFVLISSLYLINILGY